MKPGHARACFRVTIGVVLASACIACDQGSLPPRGQIIVVVDTDAIAPLERGAQRDPTRLPAQVDRARFEVLVDGKPLAGSTREVAVDEAMFRAQRVSFGVLPAPEDAAVSVRIRLFRADRVSTGEPPAGVTLDTIATLPPVATEGVTTVSVLLRVDDFGRTVGPIAASPGGPTSSAVGTWRGGRRVGCSGVADASESCVPGGAFFFGDLAFRGRAPTNDVTDERLVWVSPFFLDRTEVTVGAFRERWSALAANVSPPLARNEPDGAACTWTETSAWLPDGAPLDRLPLNCVSWKTASAYCHARGGELPTEAQIEYASSGLGEEQAYPWGNDEPDCATAIWGRAVAGSDGSSSCLAASIPARPAFPGFGTRDRVDTAAFGFEGEIVDLGGNLSEWALDVWSQPSEAFWRPLTPMIDPLATFDGIDGDARPARGGNWDFRSVRTRAATRIKRGPDERVPIVGFRCARRAKEAP